MPSLPKPPKPLKVLTIDGGGLQAISTLLILDKLLDTIATRNGVEGRRPRPCDVFDTIAGIGAGGWLALLLGRFQLDITSCLTEWYSIIDCIAPRSKKEELRMRFLQHCYFDTDRLVRKIDQLAAIYGTGEALIRNDSESPRCKHVFVAALKTNGKEDQVAYNLFRTYERPEGLKLLAGPENPSTYKISHAFAATGAAKYFTPPWKAQMENGIISKFSDHLPQLHNISELALDEMWGLYGNDVQLSVVVNIGPGHPSPPDIMQIAKRFSWGLNPSDSKTRNIPKPQGASAIRSVDRSTNRQSSSRRKDRSHRAGEDESHVRFSPEAQDQNPVSSSPDVRRQLRHIGTFGSEVGVNISEKLRRKENEIERDIKKKLYNIYGPHYPPYFRLAPQQSPEGTCRNDLYAPRLVSEATAAFLNTAGDTMDDISQNVTVEAVG
ncbi:hypothetical protein MMC30_003056 [Trapelia coarctata]|nr:hypothetical protein [Trapelia coarctata]